MTEIYVKRTMSGLAPVDEHGESALKRFHVGDVAKVKLTKPRNAKHHRLYFALLNLVLKNQERFSSIDELNAAIKIYVGHVDLIEVGGEIHKVPKSINFASMNQSEFSAFYDRVIQLVCTQIIPALDEGDLRAEIMEIVGNG